MTAENPRWALDRWNLIPDTSGDPAISNAPLLTLLTAAANLAGVRVRRRPGFDHAGSGSTPTVGRFPTPGSPRDPHPLTPNPYLEYSSSIPRSPDGDMLLLLSLLASIAQAAVLAVDPSGPGYATISAAVAAATSGDTISVVAGTYSEAVNTGSLTLTIEGVGPDTVLTWPAGTALTIGGSVTLRDLAITGSQRGIYVSGSLEAEGVVLSANGTTANGGATLRGPTTRERACIPKRRHPVKNRLLRGP